MPSVFDGQLVKAKVQIDNWKQRSLIRIILANHASSKHPVMSLKLGVVSLHYHVQFEDFFDSAQKWEDYMPKRMASEGLVGQAAIEPKIKMK